MNRADTSYPRARLICAVDDLVPDAGVAALVEGEQIAIFHLPDAGKPGIFAIGNYDPIGNAPVLSRGIVGDVGGGTRRGIAAVQAALQPRLRILLRGRHGIRARLPDAGERRSSVPDFLVAAEQSIRTTCPYCGVGCGVIARTDGRRLIAVTGDPIHPANAGRLCVKGTALPETQQEHGRLLYPEVDGVRSSWETALNRVADGFRETLARHGPGSVAFYLSGQLLTEDYYVANKLMKGFMGSANVDTNSRLCMASAVAAHKRAFGEDVVPLSLSGSGYVRAGRLRRLQCVLDASGALSAARRQKSRIRAQSGSDRSPSDGHL